MRGTHNNPSVSKVLSGYNLQYNQLMNHIQQFQSSEINFLEVLKNNNKILDEIQHSIELLLEKKRQDFPRFYFLSNDELLQILSQGSKDPLNVEIHLRKLFEGVVKIEVDLDEII